METFSSTVLCLAIIKGHLQHHEAYVLPSVIVIFCWKSISETYRKESSEKIRVHTRGCRFCRSGKMVIQIGIFLWVFLVTYSQKHCGTITNTSIWAIRINLPLKRDLVLNRQQEFLNLRNNEIIPLLRKLNDFIYDVRRDIRMKRISEAEGQRLIIKVSLLVSTWTTRI
jgi:hypothetical protein